MYCPVCGMVNIKDPLLLIRKSCTDNQKDLPMWWLQISSHYLGDL